MRMRRTNDLRHTPLSFASLAENAMRSSAKPIRGRVRRDGCIVVVRGAGAGFVCAERRSRPPLHRFCRTTHLFTLHGIELLARATVGGRSVELGLSASEPLLGMGIHTSRADID